METEKRVPVMSLLRNDQAWAFTHLMNVLEGATTYKQLKSAFWERTKLENEIKKDLGLSSGAFFFLLSYYDNQAFFDLYLYRRDNDFAADVDAEMDELQSQVEIIEKFIFEAKTIGQLKDISKEIYSKVKKADAKKYLNEVLAKAYKELMSLSA